jgi:hypothetical protein
MAQQSVGDSGGLLSDLLEHEVVVAALLGGREIPVDVKGAGIGGVVISVEIGDPVAVSGDHHGLVLAEFDGFTGVGDERRDVGAEEHLALADPDHQRRGPPRRDDGAGVVGVGENQCEVTLQPAQDGKYRGDEIAGGITVVVGAGHQVHRHLGIGVTGELHALRLEFGT